MKIFWFAALIAVIAALECSLILAGVLPVLSAYSFGHAIFIAVMFGVLAYMGWSLYRLKKSMKGILFRGSLVMLVSVIILCLAVLVGFNSGKPVLGVSVPAAIYVVPILVIYAATNAVLGAFFAGCGALAARKMKRKK
jgi:lysylphosphatidylglycerol synthetase-like protein (DUF2156 family)